MVKGSLMLENIIDTKLKSGAGLLHKAAVHNKELREGVFSGSYPYSVTTTHRKFSLNIYESCLFMLY